MLRDEVVSKLLHGYEGYFDVVDCVDEELGLIARCDFHVHNAKYVLVKKAQLWQADCHEYVFIFSVPVLDEEAFSKCEDFVIKEGFSLVKPQSGHMYTYITAAFVCDDITEGAVRLLKKSKHYKSYKFTIHGWAELRMYAIRAAERVVYHNRAGRGCVKFVKKLLK